MRIPIDRLRVSQDVFNRNEESGCPDGQEPCNVCGKATNPVNFVHIVNYGNMYTDETIEEEDSLGWHAVGPCCFKKIKKAFGGSYPTVDVDGVTTRTPVYDVKPTADPGHYAPRSAETISNGERKDGSDVCDNFCVDNQGICHNCGHSEASHAEVKTWLCYYELHVDDETFLVHKAIDARTEDEAFEKLDKGARNGAHFHLQAKGVIGLATDTREVVESLKDV